MAACRCCLLYVQWFVSSAVAEYGWMPGSGSPLKLMLRQRGVVCEQVALASAEE